jgi:post-segregation antitoxin (ccd killing protein)
MGRAPKFRYLTQRAGDVSMVILMKFKRYLIHDAEALDSAVSHGIDVSEVVEEANLTAAKTSNRNARLDESQRAFSAQSEWHKTRGHPRADIIVSPVAASWG